MPESDAGPAKPDPVLDYRAPDTARSRRPREPWPWWLVRSAVALVFGASGLWLLYCGIADLSQPAGAPSNFFAVSSLALVLED